MHIPTIKPQGISGQTLLFSDTNETVSANPHLVFASTRPLYSPAPQHIHIIPGRDPLEGQALFTAHRLTRAALTEGIYGPSTSPELDAYIGARKAFESYCDVEMGIARLKQVNPDSRFFDEFRKNAPALPDPPKDIPVTVESRLLPAGSILLCRTEKTENGAKDTWYSLTQEEFWNENLARVCASVFPDGSVEVDGDAASFSSKHSRKLQERSVSAWPSANRAAHLADIRFNYKPWYMQLMEWKPAA